MQKGALQLQLVDCAIAHGSHAGRCREHQVHGTVYGGGGGTVHARLAVEPVCKRQQVGKLVGLFTY